MASPADVLGRISNLIQRGASDIASTRITGAQLGLQGAKQAFEMDRYRKYQEPVEALGASQAQKQMEFDKSPLNLLQFAKGSPLDRARSLRYAAPEIANLFDAEPDEAGNLIHKETGRPITNADARPFSGMLQSIFVATTSLPQLAEDVKAERQFSGPAFAGMEESGSRALAKRFEDAPLQALEKQHGQLLQAMGLFQSFGKPTTIIEKGLARVEGEMQAYTKAQAERAKETREQNRALERIEVTAKEARKTKGVSAPPKEGDTRVFRRGTKQVTQEYRGGKWRRLAEGEAFKPTVGAGKGALKPSDYKTGIQTIFSYLAKDEDELTSMLGAMAEIDVKKEPEKAMSILAQVTKGPRDRLKDRIRQGDKEARLLLQQADELHVKMMEALGVSTTLETPQAQVTIINRETGERMYLDPERNEWLPIE
jgi:hypothetical protein